MLSLSHPFLPELCQALKGTSEGRDGRGASWMGQSFDSAAHRGHISHCGKSHGSQGHKQWLQQHYYLERAVAVPAHCWEGQLGTGFFGIITEKCNTLLCLVVYYWWSCWSRGVNISRHQSSKVRHNITAGSWTRSRKFHCAYL